MLKNMAGDYLGNSGSGGSSGGADWSHLANLGNQMENHQQSTGGGSDLSSFTSMYGVIKLLCR